MITTRFPNATVNNQAAWHMAFMLIGAWMGERGGREERERERERGREGKEREEIEEKKTKIG